MTKYLTAKEKMERGEWKLYKKIYKGLNGMYVYLGEREGKEGYTIHYMDYLTRKGVFVYGSITVVLKVLRVLLNLINKGTGEELFGDIIDEVQEFSRARKHKQSTGSSFGCGGLFETEEEIEEEVGRQIDDKVKGLKEKRCKMEGVKLK